MTDIVERLAHVAVWCQSNDLPLFANTAAEAKTEIERLRAENERLMAALQEIVDCAYGLSPDWEKKERVGRIARRALEGKDG